MSSAVKMTPMRALEILNRSESKFPDDNEYKEAINLCRELIIRNTERKPITRPFVVDKSTSVGKMPHKIADELRFCPRCDNQIMSNKAKHCDHCGQALKVKD